MFENIGQTLTFRFNRSRKHRKKQEKRTNFKKKQKQLDFVFTANAKIFAISFCEKQKISQKVPKVIFSISVRIV